MISNNQKRSTYFRTRQKIMPTIEILSINSKKINLRDDEFKVALIQESKLISHRGLFTKHLQKYEGVIFHIGNPEFKKEKNPGFYAGKIINWNFDGSETINKDLRNQQFEFKFLNKYKQDINNLLELALLNSPVKKIMFLTDYQFGQKKAKVKVIKTILDFWKLHDKGELVFNTIYEICET